jgi:hypothetical protein
MLVWDSCQEYGIPVRPFPPQWMRNGRKNFGAGLIRNAEMINQADLVLAFWDDGSRGTAHAIVYGHQVGKLYRIYSPPGNEQDPEKLLRKAYSVRLMEYPEPVVQPVEANESTESESTPTP